jgi:hypothetical protein
MKAKFDSATDLLTFLNTEYSQLHANYEKLFWISYMGDHSIDKAKDKAQISRDAFRSNETLSNLVDAFLLSAKNETKESLKLWKTFFERYQIPKEVLQIKDKITQLESKIMLRRSKRKEGYIDPQTNTFVKSSENEMRMSVRTNPDEKIRKALFYSLEKLTDTNLKEYVQLVSLLNKYATSLGYTDFYDYKVFIEEGMTKKELFSIFDTIYQKTKYGFKNIRKLEKTKKGLRKPWNFGYMMSGSFTKEEDQYFQFEEALLRWGRSFSSLGIDYQKGKLVLDLLDRKGKWNNGFCHWPQMVTFKDGKYIPGISQFTCNVVNGQVGSGVQGYNTLFHEGGHAAHLLNSKMKDVAVNHEYAPMSTAWAETQSMFLDTLFSSIEWKIRYAKNTTGDSYPISLYEKKIKTMEPLMPLNMMGIMYVMYFEKEIYETKNLTEDKVKLIARKVYRKFFDRSEDSLSVLNVPHIYSWESICSYHGYGLAELSLSQWRQYFYKKYNYIVDNPNVGKEMTKVWQYAGSKSYAEFVKIATGKKLSSTAYIESVTRSAKEQIKLAQKRTAYMKKIPISKKSVNLNATIEMVDGKKKITDSSKGFEVMAEEYKKWLQ